MFGILFFVNKESFQLSESTCCNATVNVGGKQDIFSGSDTSQSWEAKLLETRAGRGSKSHRKSHGNSNQKTGLK